jgi:hypothetical protein
MALRANVAMAATVERAVAERWCGAPYGSLFVTASNRPSRAAAAASDRSPVVADVERREEGRQRLGQRGQLVRRGRERRELREPARE